VKSLPRLGVRFVTSALLICALLGSSHAQDNAHPLSSDKPPQATATITAIGISHDKSGPAVEIVSSRPVVPVIQQLEGPPRLVIDLPHSRLAVRQKRMNVQKFQISAIRADQYQSDPPVTRVVVDLLEQRGYTWTAAGNRLLVRLNPVENVKPATESASTTSPFQPPSVIGLSSGVETAVMPANPGGAAVMLAGSRVPGGSSVTAGADTAVLRIGRGGEIRVCPGTTVSVTASQSGRQLMLGMSTGALETHYNLDASADSILTPDFRILLPGLGDFNFAVSADAQGNTCVRALKGNTASAIVSELMGDRTYQVKPTDQLVFHAGRLDKVDESVPLECGCPPPRPPVMWASTPELPVAEENDLPARTRLATSAGPLRAAVPVAGMGRTNLPPEQVNLAVTQPETAPLPRSRPNEVHISVEAPFVFRATDPQPAPAREAERMPMVAAARQPELQSVALPPTVPKTGAQPLSTRSGPRRFLRRVRGFFAAIFR
jgi:AMIN domain-containing protein